MSKRKEFPCKKTDSKKKRRKRYLQSEELEQVDAKCKNFHFPIISLTKANNGKFKMSILNTNYPDDPHFQLGFFEYKGLFFTTKGLEAIISKEYVQDEQSEIFDESEYQKFVDFIGSKRIMIYNLSDLWKYLKFQYGKKCVPTRLSNFLQKNEPTLGFSDFQMCQMSLVPVRMTKRGFNTCFFGNLEYVYKLLEECNRLHTIATGKSIFYPEAILTETNRLYELIGNMQTHIDLLKQKIEDVRNPDSDLNEPLKRNQKRNELLDTLWERLKKALYSTNFFNEVDVYIETFRSICNENAKLLTEIGNDFLVFSEKRKKLHLLGLMYGRHKACNFFQIGTTIVDHVGGGVHSVDRLHDCNLATSDSHFYNLIKRASRATDMIIEHLYSQYCSLDVVFIADNYNAKTKVDYIKRKNNELLHRCLKAYKNSDRKYASMFKNVEVKLDLENNQYFAGLKNTILKSYDQRYLYKIGKKLTEYDKKFFQEANSSKNTFSLDLEPANCKKWQETLPKMMDLIKNVKKSLN